MFRSFFLRAQIRIGLRDTRLLTLAGKVEAPVGSPLSSQGLHTWSLGPRRVGTAPLRCLQGRYRRAHLRAATRVLQRPTRGPHCQRGELLKTTSLAYEATCTTRTLWLSRSVMVSAHTSVTTFFCSSLSFSLNHVFPFTSIFISHSVYLFTFLFVILSLPIFALPALPLKFFLSFFYVIVVCAFE